VVQLLQLQSNNYHVHLTYFEKTRQIKQYPAKPTMCTGDRDVYSCGCTKKEYPLKECPHKRWGQPCPYDIVVNRYWGKYPCADCHRIRSLEDRVRILEDDNARLRMQSGPRYGYRERQREGEGARLRSEIAELRRKKRVRFEI
jgi:hypothetical protein